MIFLRPQKPKRNTARYRPVDDRRSCVVPSCGVRSRRLDADGICPPELHDNKHMIYVAALRMERRRTA